MEGQGLGPGILDAVSTLAPLIDLHRSAISELTRQHKGRTIALFGSVARGDDTDTSDIDFLVEFEDGSRLFDILHLQEALRELIGREVDVVWTLSEPGHHRSRRPGPAR
jgi:uncharacterized protein